MGGVPPMMLGPAQCEMWNVKCENREERHGEMGATGNEARS